MPRSPSEYMEQLDEINKHLALLQNDLEDAARNYVTLKAQYELVEANVMRNKAYSAYKLGEKEKIAPEVAEEQHNNLYTRLSEAKSALEGLDRTLKIWDITRSNVQSNLKSLTRVES